MKGSRVLRRLIDPAHDAVRTRLGQRVAGGPRRRTSRLDRLAVHSTIRHLHGRTDIELGPDEAVTLCVVRNGGHHVREFIEHHLHLGSKQVILLDNGSTDETLDVACGYRRRVTVLSSHLPFRTYVHSLKSYLLSRFGTNQLGWCLRADIDERFDFFGRPQVSFRYLLRYLNESGFDAVAGHMLDVFQNRPLAASAPPSEPWFYDLSHLQPLKYERHLAIADRGLPGFQSGITGHVFKTKVNLRKYPLITLRGRLSAANTMTHRLEVRGTRVADFSTVLYHYQYGPNFTSKVAAAVEAKNYANDSRRYRSIKTRLEGTPDLNLYEEAPDPQPVEDVGALVDRGFVYASRKHRAFVEHCRIDTKVFCIGFHKTGTTSMGELLTRLGYHVCGALRTRDQDFVDKLAAGDLEDLFEVADRYTAMQDNPWPIFFEELDARYPNSRFIMTTRDPNHWLRSIVNHFGREPRMSPMRTFIYGHGSPVGAEQTYYDRLVEHERRVKAYFRDRPNDLLVVDLSDHDAMPRICDFLGRRGEFTKMPHANKRL